MDKTGFKKELGVVLDKIDHMRPEPPWNDLNSSHWGKVDKLVKKLLNWLVEDEVPKPIDTLTKITFNMAMENLARPVQTLSWRTLDTWLLIYESRRIRGIVKSDTPWDLSRPSKGDFWIPPSIDDDIYRGETKEALKVINNKLRDRGIIKAPKGD